MLNHLHLEKAREKLPAVKTCTHDTSRVRAVTAWVTASAGVMVAVGATAAAILVTVAAIRLGSR